MTDEQKELVARLRSVDISWSQTGEWCAEAADMIDAQAAEIERLRAGVAEERARIAALLFDWFDSGSVDGMICRSKGLEDFIKMLAQETQP